MRAVLKASEFTPAQTFADRLEFVEYAQKHQPQLDLLTPPKRSGHGQLIWTDIAGVRHEKSLPGGCGSKNR